MNLDVASLRTHFPSLQSGIAHFEGPGGTQTPVQVAEAMASTLTGPLSNRGTSVLSERNAEESVHAFRQAFSDMLGVAPGGIVHGRSATQLTFDFSRAIARSWQAGDEIVLSRLDHDANVRPWVIAAEAKGITVRWIDFDPATAEVVWESVESAINERTKLVAVTAASNVLGTRPPVRAVADLAHAVGALVYVDGVHYAAHEPVAIESLGADFFVCSPYKFMGPHCGVLAADPELLETLHPDKLLPSPDRVPERFELGTLPYEQLAGATAAVDFIANLASDAGETRRERLHAAFRRIDAHEARLRDRVFAELSELGDRVVFHSLARDHTPTLLMSFPGRDVTEVADSLAAQKIAAPAGDFYAYEPFQRLQLPGNRALRAGMAPYVDDDGVSRLIEGIAACVGK